MVFAAFAHTWVYFTQGSRASPRSCLFLHLAQLGYSLAAWPNGLQRCTRVFGCLIEKQQLHNSKTRQGDFEGRVLTPLMDEMSKGTRSGASSCKTSLPRMLRPRA